MPFLLCLVTRSNYLVAALRLLMNNLRLQLLSLFALTELTSGQLHSPIKHQSILFRPHQKYIPSLSACCFCYTVSRMYFWWSRRVPPPGPVCRLNCFNVTILFITQVILDVNLYFNNRCLFTFLF